MKKSIVTICLIVLCFVSNAQSVNDNVNLKQMLFNHFLAGNVYMKNNTVIAVPLNYNTDKQSLVFIENGEYKELAGLESIDSIIIESVKFVPLKNKIFECTSNKDLFVLYSNVAIPNQATTDRTGSHKEKASEVSNTVSNVYVNRNFTNLNDIKFVKHFWIKDKNDFIELKQPKQIAKVFNLEKNAVADYIEKNKIDLNFEPDILKLIAFIKSSDPVKK